MKIYRRSYRRSLASSLLNFHPLVDRRGSAISLKVLLDFTWSVCLLLGIRTPTLLFRCFEVTFICSPPTYMKTAALLPPPCANPAFAGVFALSSAPGGAFRYTQCTTPFSLKYLTRALRLKCNIDHYLCQRFFTTFTRRSHTPSKVYDRLHNHLSPPCLIIGVIRHGAYVL